MRNRAYELVPLASCFVDDYQRELDPKRSETIATNFDPAKLDPPLVNERVTSFGRYAIVDGQQRTMALKAKGVKETMCAVIAVSKEDEGELFLHQYDNTRKLNPRQIFNARVALENPEALAIATIVKNHKWQIPSRTKSRVSGIPVLKTTTGITDVYRMGGRDILDQTLTTIVDCWGESEFATHHDLTRGVGRITMDYGTKIDHDILDRWRRIPAINLLEAAKDKGAQSTRAFSVATRLREKGGLRKIRGSAY